MCTFFSGIHTLGELAPHRTELSVLIHEYANTGMFGDN